MKNIKYIEEEITLHEFADRFLNYTNYDTPREFDIENFDIDILTLDLDGNEVYAPINSFIIKPKVSEYYTDGNIKVSADHKFVEGEKYLSANKMPKFKKINDTLNIVDICVSNYHTYIANGHLNHNTTSGGKAIGFHSSQRVFLKSVGKIEGQINGVNTPVGMKTLATVVKNRLGPPLRAINYDIYFDRGVDDYGSWIYGLKSMGFIKVSGAWSYFEYVDGTTGELITKKYQSDGLAKMLREDEKFRTDVYDILCDNFIMKYNSTHDIDLVFTDGEIED